MMYCRHLTSWVKPCNREFLWCVTAAWVAYHYLPLQLANGLFYTRLGLSVHYFTQVSPMIYNSDVEYKFVPYLLASLDSLQSISALLLSSNYMYSDMQGYWAAGITSCFWSIANLPFQSYISIATLPYLYLLMNYQRFGMNAVCCSLQNIDKRIYQRTT